MRVAAVSLVLALAMALSGCASETLSPPPSPVLEAPELSQPREQHKTADPPPPIREQRHASAYTSAQQAAAAQGPPPAPSPIATPPPPGTGTPLGRAPAAPPEEGENKPPSIVR
ncbi:hypothetical protein HY251_07145 [bacterium]|nr:hypothetical protein [bacterium]